MKALYRVFRELFEHIRENKRWWLIPTVLMLIILWLLIVSAGQSSVPVFVYPMV